MALKTAFVPVRRSLLDLIGDEYVRAACAAEAFLSGQDGDFLMGLVTHVVDFLEVERVARWEALLPRVGEIVGTPVANTAVGTSSATFEANTKVSQAPVAGAGYFRVGENGKLYFTAKSEHYHAPLGHGFPGYELIEIARKIGIPNATHNNTRGHITRLLEERLADVVSGTDYRAKSGQARGPAPTMSDNLPHAYKVLNLETGSLAGEAAVKFILNRFYRMQEDVPAPKYDGLTPVFLVLGDDEGGAKGNYHGTTILTQCLRGMWPEMTARYESDGLFAVWAVRPNVIEDVERAFAEFEKPPYKIAAFFHEIVMMNYGARTLSKEFLQKAYALCERHDVPTVADEIQSCLWAPELFLFKEYGLQPSMALAGKGFPGGEYAASRIVFRADLDTLPQFGALITNGQQELAALAYLITMEWARANADVTRAIGDYYQERLAKLAERYPRDIKSIDGSRHMAGIMFHDLDRAKRFTAVLNETGIDISVQTYKGGCPPCALTKLPLIASAKVVDWLVDRMDAGLRGLA
jgi:acetylornithine/succinyldiaminopimelate/putrescine aminotransferase